MGDCWHSNGGPNGCILPALRGEHALLEDQAHHRVPIAAFFCAGQWCFRGIAIERISSHPGEMCMTRQVVGWRWRGETLWGLNDDMSKAISDVNSYLPIRLIVISFESVPILVRSNVVCAKHWLDERWMKLTALRSCSVRDSSVST